MAKADGVYWGTKITVAYGERLDKVGILYTKDEHFARTVKMCIESSGFKATLSKFHKPEK